MIKRITYFFLILAIFFDRSESGYPTVTCPNIFRYERVHNSDVGIITLQKVNYGETEVEVELSQPGVIYGNNQGSLSLNTDQDKYIEHIQSGTPITYKVDFPLQNVVPQVSSIRVNGQTLCSGPRVPPPSTTISLQYSMTATGPINAPRLINFQGSWPNSHAQPAHNQSPRNPCPDIFQYGRDKSVGFITIESLNFGISTLEVELSQPGSLNAGMEGYINLNINENEVADYIKSRRPIMYKVNFPTRNVVPQVNSIRINGNTICSGPSVAPPSTTMTLRHTLTATTPYNTDSEGYRLIPPMHSHWDIPANDSVQHFHDLNLMNPMFRQLQNQYSNFDNRYNGNGNRRPTESIIPTTTKAPLTTPQLSQISIPRQTTSRPVITLRSTSTTSTTTTTTPRPHTTTPRTTMATVTVKPDGPATLEYINSVCGRENVNFAVKKLAFRGETIPRSRFPWIVALYKKSIGTLEFQCGGSIISTRTVISAAHCFYEEFTEINNENILVSMGRHNLIDWTDSYITHSDVEKIIRHPDYRPELVNIDADLALVWLKNTVTFSHSIRPVCLWQGPLNVRDIEGVSGIVVGWGRDENNNNITSLPRLVRANVASEITCIRSNSQMFYLTSNRTLCAGNRDGTGPCNGDSGSGLMIRNRNKWMLRGTVSAALGSAVNQCNLEEYVVYTDIAMFITWIHENMRL